MRMSSANVMATAGLALSLFAIWRISQTVGLFSSTAPALPPGGGGGGTQAPGGTGTQGGQQYLPAPGGGGGTQGRGGYMPTNWNATGTGTGTGGGTQQGGTGTMVQQRGGGQ